MRVLLDARTVGTEFSGVGNYVLELVKAFAALDDDTEYVLLSNRPSLLEDLPFDARFRLRPTRISPESHPLGDAWEQVVLPRIAIEERADVLHGPAFLIPTCATRVRKVVTVHDLVAFTHPKTIPWKYGVYMRWLLRRAVARAERVITGSRSTRQDLVRILGADQTRIDTVPYGVGERFAVPSDDAVAAVREKLALANPYLLFVGNLEPRKNLPGLLEAYRLLREDHPGPLDLVVAGKVAWLSSPLLDKLRSADLADSVRVTGYVDAADLPALYGGAEAFVFPTFWEGFGLPVLEAMACGAPVVASGISSIPEVAGDAAVLVNPHDAASIAGGIRDVLGDPARAAALRGRGLERVERFRWRGTALGTLASYRAAHNGVPR